MKIIDVNKSKLIAQLAPVITNSYANYLKKSNQTFDNKVIIDSKSIIEAGLLPEMENYRLKIVNNRDNTDFKYLVAEELDRFILDNTHEIINDIKTTPILRDKIDQGFQHLAEDTILKMFHSDNRDILINRVKSTMVFYGESIKTDFYDYQSLLETIKHKTPDLLHEIKYGVNYSSAAFKNDISYNLNSAMIQHFKELARVELENKKSEKIENTNNIHSKINKYKK